MECSICKTSLTEVPRNGVPTNTICGACYKGAKDIINLMNKLKTENGNTEVSTSTHSPTSSCKSLSNASKWVMDLTIEKSFFHGIVDAYRNQPTFDILVEPGNNGSPIAAHKAILVASSKIFELMLEFCTGKSPHLETLTLAELNYEELKALLEFLYSGSLSEQKMEEHMYPLSLVADKYDIIYLQKFIQNFMLRSLHTRNALLILEISNFYGFRTVRDDILTFIVKNKRDIVFSEVFSAKNPHLCFAIKIASLKDAKKND